MNRRERERIARNAIYARDAERYRKPRAIGQSRLHEHGQNGIFSGCGTAELLCIPIHTVEYRPHPTDATGSK